MRSYIGNLYAQLRGYMEKLATNQSAQFWLVWIIGAVVLMALLILSRPTFNHDRSEGPDSADWNVPGPFPQLPDYKKSQKQIHGVIEEEINGAFERVDARASTFVDFHYSLRGQYTELLAWIAGKLGANIQDVFGFDAQLNDAMEKIVKRVDAIRLLSRRSDAEGTGILDHNDMVSDLISLAKEDIQARFTPSWVGLRMTAVLVGAATGGIACGRMGPPGWLVCGVIGGTFGWLAADVMIIRTIRRDLFEGEVKRIINQQKENTKSQIKQQYDQLLRPFLNCNIDNFRQSSPRDVPSCPQEQLPDTK
jgi:hypothetical protein